ncbi:hypothetical protein [Streptomyces yokosukanensis]|uniref:hypothetical protein n=1 Tax=Streptomyces yokosukanensis TaxID=67386 RepID=UPI003CC66C91
MTHGPRPHPPHPAPAPHRPPSPTRRRHDMDDEAIVLADRVLVLDRGRIGLDLTIDLDRPRGAYRAQLLAALGVTEDHT